MHYFYHLINLPLFKEIIAFVINNNEGGKVGYFNSPNSFHTWKERNEEELKTQILKVVRRTISITKRTKHSALRGIYG